MIIKICNLREGNSNQKWNKHANKLGSNSMETAEGTAQGLL